MDGYDYALGMKDINGVEIKKNSVIRNVKHSFYIRGAHTIEYIKGCHYYKKQLQDYDEFYKETLDSYTEDRNFLEEGNHWEVVGSLTESGNIDTIKE